MADIFLSYASSDRERARVLAEALGERGLKVWWDRTIPPGRVFDEVIQEALQTAKCIVVLWSAESVKSNWVKTEAGEGLAQGKLVPALIEAVASGASTARSYHTIPPSRSPASTSASPKSSATSPRPPHLPSNSFASRSMFRSCSATSTAWNFVRTMMRVSASFNADAEPIQVKSSIAADAVTVQERNRLP